LSAFASHTAAAARPSHRHPASRRAAPSLRTPRGLTPPGYCLPLVARQPVSPGMRILVLMAFRSGSRGWPLLV
jgi:hypothetical protein